jgi:hypothetical protein
MATATAITICWSVKGGSGTSTVAAALAMLSPTLDHPPLLVDLSGDAHTIVGVDAPVNVGLSDWFDSQAGPAVLDTLCVHTKSSIDVLPTTVPIGSNPRRWDEFVAWLDDQALRRHIVVDAGHYPRPTLTAQSLLVVRPCYLAIYRAAKSSNPPVGIVLIRESERTLTNADIEAAVGAPIVAEIPIDPSIARSVDAGLINARIPRTLARPLRKLLVTSAMQESTRVA